MFGICYQHTASDNQRSDDDRVLGDTQQEVSMDLQTVQSSSANQRPPTRQQQRQDKPDTNTLYEHITDDQAEVCVTSYTICLVWLIIAHLLILTLV